MSFNDVLNSNIENNSIKSETKSEVKNDKQKKDKSTNIQIKIPTIINTLPLNKKS